MKKNKRIFVFVFVAIISLGSTVITQQGPSSKDIAVQKLNLSGLSPETTYKFSIGSDEPLTISPYDYVETSLIPIQGEYEGIKVIYQKQPDIKHLQFEGYVNYTANISESDNISYSALFGPVNSDYKWGFHYPYQLFVDSLNAARADSYRVESIDIYTISTTDSNFYSYYAGTWVKDKENIEWDWGLDWDKDLFISKLDSLKNNSCRITDIEYDILNQRFGCVWTKDNKGWFLAVDYDYDSFIQIADSQNSVGRRPIDFQIYLNESRKAFLYAGIWIDTTEGEDYSSFWAVNYRWSDFDNLAYQQHVKNYRMIDYESYMTPDGQRYAGIWVDDGLTGGYLLNYTDFFSFLSELYTFSNNSLRPVSFDMFIDSLFIGIKDNELPTINTYNLAQNYPNPFNAITTIEFEIPENAFVTITIYNILGIEVATLVNEKLLAGRHRIQFNAEKLSSGIYFYRMEALGKTTIIQNKKMSLLK